MIRIVVVMSLFAMGLSACGIKDDPLPIGQSSED